MHKKEVFSLYDSTNIAFMIKRVAKEKNIIIKDMLIDCDLGSNTMSSLRHGKSIAYDSLAKIADYLKVSVDYLLGRPSVHNELNDLCDAFIKADEVTKENIKKLLDL